MRGLWRWIAAAGLAAGTLTQAQESTAVGAKALKFVAPLRIEDCSPVTPTPCFFTTFAPVDVSSQPAAVALPPKDSLLDAVKLQVNGIETAPFYVSTGAGPASSLRRSVVLIEIDISGSMNDKAAGAASRFEAARSAITEYIRSTQEGIDRVAIVPFESHQVVPTIQAAVFSSRRSDLVAQVAALPSPSPKNNTALYQAVFTGVETLEREVARDGSSADVDAKLIVMTDGKNEVLKGDDGNLLTGPLGLEQASAKVRASGLDIVGIGFGEPSTIDQPALAQLSKRHFLAQSLSELRQIFRATETLHPSQISVGFLSPWTDRQSLAARDVAVGAVLTLPGGAALSSDAEQWHAPAMGSPLFRKHAGSEEMQALIRRTPPPLTAWNTLVRGILVLFGISALLLLLWFWVPRLIWPDGTMPPAQRWGKSVCVQASGAQVRSTKAPAGFAAAGEKLVSQRSPGQVTQVQPRGDFAKTRRISDA